MDIDGGNLKQLTREDEYSHVFSPDGRWVIYDSRRSDVVNLWKVSIEGGSPTQLTDTFTYFPAVSPDGKLIASHLTDRQDGDKRKVVIIPIEGGAPVKTLDFTPTPLFGSWGSLRWSPDGRSLFYADRSQGGVNLWRLPIDGSPPQPITRFSDFKTERILSFDLTRDGKQFILARGGSVAEVVLISEVK
jgi:Tol biopolymer transport system component